MQFDFLFLGMTATYNFSCPVFLSNPSYLSLLLSLPPMLVYTSTDSGDSNSVVVELSSSCSVSQGCGTESQETDSS